MTTPQDALESHLWKFLSGDAHQMAVVRFLGLTSDIPVRPGPSPLDTLAGRLEECLTYREFGDDDPTFFFPFVRSGDSCRRPGEGERDMVILYTEVRGGGRKFQCYFITEGDSKWSAMAKTVDIPIATVAELILEGRFLISMPRMYGDDNR